MFFCFYVTCLQSQQRFQLPEATVCSAFLSVARQCAFGCLWLSLALALHHDCIMLGIMLADSSVSLNVKGSCAVLHSLLSEFDSGKGEGLTGSAFSFLRSSHDAPRGSPGRGIAPRPGHENLTCPPVVSMSTESTTMLLCCAVLCCASTTIFQKIIMTSDDYGRP